MKQRLRVVHMVGDSGNIGTYCGWLLNDERRIIRDVRRVGLFLPLLATWERWCLSCRRVRNAK